MTVTDALAKAFTHSIPTGVAEENGTTGKFTCETYEQVLDKGPFSCSTITIKKGKNLKHYLPSKGNCFVIIEKGIVSVSQFNDSTDKEEVLTFLADGDPISIELFLSTDFSTYMLSAIENTSIRVWRTSHEEISSISSLINEIKIHLLKSQISRLLSDIAILSARNGQDRYHSLMKNRPAIIQKLKVKDLACFLGITPEQLSRIRGKAIKPGRTVTFFQTSTQI